MGAFRAKNVKNTKKERKARMRVGCRGVQGSRGVWGGPGGSRGGPGGVQRFWAEKHEKSEKRSNIHQDFVQEVPVGQMAQGTPFPTRQGGSTRYYPCHIYMGFGDFSWQIFGDPGCVTSSYKPVHKWAVITNCS